jgi:para-nitrobenzyl esterase
MSGHARLKYECLAAMALSFCLPSAAVASCLVTIDSGDVQGALVGQTCRYLGIPYAGSPAGNGRWKPPTVVASFGGLLHADVAPPSGFGPMCPQPMVVNGVTTVVGKEDCLNLNVYGPAVRTSPLPVIVFLHGGGNRMASNRAAGVSLDGAYLAEHGSVVVVTINFRLGALGWLAHPSLDAESGTSGNYGILDQIAALEWVQRNVAAFGGDPGRVTITGQSAGANDVGVLLASPSSKGLFATVLIEAAGELDQPSLPDYEANVGLDVVNKLGCAGATDVPACLRAVPAATIVKTVPGSGGLAGSTYGPVVDGIVLPQNVQQTAKEGAHNHAPLIIGGTDKESSFPGFVPLSGIDTPADYEAAVDALFAGISVLGQPVADQVLTLYPVSAYETPRLAFVAVTTDYRWICPARRLARAVSNSQKEPVYRFLFTHAQSSPAAANALGAYHTEELMFIFHTFASGVSGPFTPTPEELTLSEEMMGYWSRFAATGDPNGGDALTWFVYGKNADNCAASSSTCGGTFFDSGAQGDDKKDTFLQLDTPLAEGARYPLADVCEAFWDVLAGDTNNGHGVGVDPAGGPDSIAGDDNENAGNEAFLTPADFNDDSP